MPMLILCVFGLLVTPLLWFVAQIIRPRMDEGRRADDWRPILLFDLQHFLQGLLAKYWLSLSLSLLSCYSCRARVSPSWMAYHCGYSFSISTLHTGERLLCVELWEKQNRDHDEYHFCKQRWVFISISTAMFVKLERQSSSNLLISNWLLSLSFNPSQFSL